MSRKCFICASPVLPETHHIDWHHNNNSPDNLIILCRSCHVEIHRIGYLDRDELQGVRDQLEYTRDCSAGLNAPDCP